MTQALAPAEPRSNERPRWTGISLSRAIISSLIILASVVAAFPLVWMVLTSLN